MPTDAPDSSKRLAYYLAQILQGKSIKNNEVLGSDGDINLFKLRKPIRTRQFYEDINHLNELVPQILHKKGRILQTETGIYRWIEYEEPAEGNSDFMPFLKVILENQNYFPFSTDTWQKNLLYKYESEATRFLSTRIFYQTSPRPRNLNSKWMATIVSSLRQSIKCEMEYENSFGDRKNVLVQPLVLLNLSGVWYLLAGAAYHGYSTLDHPLQFKLNRIKGLKLTSPGVPYESFWDENYIKTNYVNVYGSLLGAGDFPEGVREVTMRFKAEAAVFAEENVLHPGQKSIEPLTMTKNIEEKDIRVRINVRYYDDAIRLALNWMGQITPEEPLEFVQKYKTIIRSLYKNLNSIDS